MAIDSFIIKKFRDICSFFNSACEDCIKTNLDDSFLNKRLDISSNIKMYRKLVDITTKRLSKWTPKCAGA